MCLRHRHCEQFWKWLGRTRKQMAHSSENADKLICISQTNLCLYGHPKPQIRGKEKKREEAFDDWNNKHRPRQLHWTEKNTSYSICCKSLFNTAALIDHDREKQQHAINPLNASATICTLNLILRASLTQRWRLINVINKQAPISNHPDVSGMTASLHLHGLPVLRGSIVVPEHWFQHANYPNQRWKWPVFVCVHARRVQAALLPCDRWPLGSTPVSQKRDGWMIIVINQWIIIIGSCQNMTFVCLMDPMLFFSYMEFRKKTVFKPFPSEPTDHLVLRAHRNVQVQWEYVFSASNTPTGWKRRPYTATNAQSPVPLPWRHRRNTEVSEDASLCTFIWFLLKSSSEFSWTLAGVDFSPVDPPLNGLSEHPPLQVCYFTPGNSAVAPLVFAPQVHFFSKMHVAYSSQKTPSAHELVKGRSRRQEHGWGGVETWRHSNPTPTPAASGKVGFG